MIFFNCISPLLFKIGYLLNSITKIFKVEVRWSKYFPIYNTILIILLQGWLLIWMNLIIRWPYIIPNIIIFVINKRDEGINNIFITKIFTLNNWLIIYWFDRNYFLRGVIDLKLLSANLVFQMTIIPCVRLRNFGNKNIFF